MELTLSQMLLLFFGSAIAGALNSFAGGGGIVVLPLLIFVGLSPTSANMTSTIAIVPGLFTSAWAYRGVIARSHRHIKVTSTIGLIGGLIGAVLLMRSPAPLFGRMVPFLMLFATGAFLYGTWFLKLKISDTAQGVSLGVGQTAMLWVLALYGGYWGGGIGLMILAALSLGGWTDINEMNATKTLFAASTNIAGVILFSLYGDVHWPSVLFLSVGGMVGGYLGATNIQKLDPQKVKLAVAVYAVGMTAYFFWRV